MEAPGQIFDRQLLRSRRRRAARRGSAPGFLLDEVAEDFRSRLTAIRRTFARGAEIGAHDGRMGKKLRGLTNVETLMQTESVPFLAKYLGPGAILCDEEYLAFANASLDLVVTGFALQWVNDLPGCLIQIRRALKPDGLLLAALLGGDTLKELREAFMVAEIELTGGAAPRVAPFGDVRQLGGLLQRAGFAMPVVDRDILRVVYETPLKLMADLRAMGAANVLVERDRRPLRRDVLARVLEFYGDKYGEADGTVPATFEIVTLTGWAPAPDHPRPLRPGSAAVRLADALGTKERTTGESAAPAKRRGK